MKVAQIQSLMHDLKFSQLIFGTWRIRDKALSLKELEQLLALCIERGVSSFDLADIYGDYQVEEFFGRALSQSLRSQVQLITKCGICLQSSARPDHKVKHYNTTASHIRKSVEQSLRMLQTSWVDLLLIHRPDPLMRFGEVAEIFTALKAEGKVRAFGVSNFSAEQMRALQTALPEALLANQIELNPLQTKALWDGTIDALQTQKALAMIWSPLAGGSLFQSQERSAVDLRACLDSLSAKYEAESDTLLLAWLLALPAKILPVLGTTDSQRLKRQLRASHISIERQDWFKILEAARGFPVA